MKLVHLWIRAYIVPVFLTGWLLTTTSLLVSKANDDVNPLGRAGDAPIQIVVDPKIDERLFLLRVLETCYEQWPRPSDDSEKLKSEVSEMRRRALKHAQYAKDQSLDHSIVSLYEDLAEMLDIYEDTITELLKVDRESMAKANRQRSKDITNSSFKGGVAAGEAFAAGASPGSAILLWAGAGLLDYILEDNGEVDQIDELKKQAVGKIVANYDKNYTQTIARAQNTSILIAKKYGWDASEVGFDVSIDQAQHITSLSQDGDFRELGRLHELSCRKRPRDPFAIGGRTINTILTLGETAKPDQLMKLSNDCLKAATLIPEGRFYDKYRSGFIASSAYIANSAVDLELGMLGYSSGPAQNALHAVKLWRTYLIFDEADTTGDSRAGLAWALAGAGRYKEALSVIHEIIKLKNDDPTFAYKVTCILCMEDRIEDAWGSFKHAIESCGFNDISTARNDPDLNKLRLQKPIEFNDLTEVKTEFSIEWGFFSDDVCLVNNSKFALTNIVLEVKVESAGYEPSFNRFETELIMPGETYRWNTRIASRGNNSKSIRSIKCDQNL